MSGDSAKLSDPVLEAIKRVAVRLDGGYDRCDADDLELLENAGLMDTGICNDAYGHDTLEAGETIWAFSEKGKLLVDHLRKTGALKEVQNDE